MTTLMRIGSETEVQSALTRLIDFLKGAGVTAVFTSLVGGGDIQDRTEESVSSLMDTWVLLRNVEFNGERNRTLYVLKSRGMAHSNQVREFIMTDHGVRLEPAYVGTSGVLTGTARVVQEMREEAERVARTQEVDTRRMQLERKRKALEARIEEMRAEYLADEQETQRLIHDVEGAQAEATVARERMIKMREGLGRRAGESPEGRLEQ